MHQLNIFNSFTFYNGCTFVNVPLMIIELAQFLYVIEYSINTQYWVGQSGECPVLVLKKSFFNILKLFFSVLQ